MTIPEPSFTIGIEEEYLLVDPETRDLANEPPHDFMAECETALKDQVRPEFLQSQVEVGTRVCNSVAEARGELVRLRSTIAAIARKYGLAPIATSTHPFATWATQHHTDRKRYNMLAEDMQVVARRLIVSGLHVHVGLDDDDLRIDLLNQASYFLPHLLALSTSSPFWQGETTGLKSYRLSVWDELPRTGIPEQFESWAQYDRTVSMLVNAGLIEDATKVWWDLRPSARFPTLEMRITDMCTYLDDAVAIAALYLCLLRMLYRLRRRNQRWRNYSPFVITENRWRVQRYGMDEGLVDFGKGTVISCEDLLEELIELVAPDAEFFGCEEEVAHTRVIQQRGTSADRQLACLNKAMNNGHDRKEGLKMVVDQLIEETMVGVEAS